MASREAKVTDTEKGIMIIIAIALTVVLIPSNIRLTPESISYTKLVSLCFTDFTQHMVTVSLPKPPYTVTISSADALALAYNHTEGLHARPSLSISLPDSAVVPGSNATFLIKPASNTDLTKVSSLAIHVFLVDPEGTVRATYPCGDRIDLAWTSDCQFSQQWNPYDTDVLDAFRAGTLALTVKIDDNDLSIGTWRIFAFITGISQSYWQVSTLGGGVASFNVTVPPRYLSFMTVTLGYLGSFLTAFRLETFLLVTARRSKGMPPRWLKDNLLLLLGIALIMVYLYLGYFPLPT